MREEIARQGLDYLALGHWHSTRRRPGAGDVRYAYSGAPEPVAVHQDRAGKVLLVTLETSTGVRTVNVEERTVGADAVPEARYRRGGVADQAAFVERSIALAGPGSRPRRAARRASGRTSWTWMWTRWRPPRAGRSSRSASATHRCPRCPTGRCRPPTRSPAPSSADVEARIAELEAPPMEAPSRRASCATSSGSAGSCSSGQRGDPVRITRLVLRDIRRHAIARLALAPGLTVVRGPNEAGKTTIQRAIELALSRKVTSTQADLDAMRPWDVGGGRAARRSARVRDEDEEATGTGRLEKSFRGPRGTVRLEVDGEVTTDPAQAEEQLAELTGIPTEPFFRSTASRPPPRARGARSATRPRSATGCRHRSAAPTAAPLRPRRSSSAALRDLQMRGERNPGRLKVAEEAVDPNGRRRSRRARPSWSCWSAIATRWRPRASGGETRSDARRGPSDAREGPAGGAAHHGSRRGERTVRAIPPGGRLSDESTTSRTRTPPITRCRCSGSSSSACGSWTATSRRSGPAWAKSVDVDFELTSRNPRGAPGRCWRWCSRSRPSQSPPSASSPPA